MINPLVNLSKVKVKLSVPLLAAYYSKQYNPTQIAKACNVSQQAVWDYTERHYDELMPLIDNTDVYAAMQAKHVAQKARNELENVIDTCKDFNKKDLIPLTAVSDRHTQQYRLLSDKSTQNVSIDAIDRRIEDRDKRLIEVEARIKQMTGE